MAAIDPEGLRKVMDLVPITAKQLVEELARNGEPISLQYVCDITAGRRTLKRNPALRRAIARVCGVPQHWIEVPAQRPEDEAA